MAQASAQVSTTIPRHLDEYLDLLATELQVSKSSLLSDAIARGLPEIVNHFVLQRRDCIAALKDKSRERDKIEAAPPLKGKPAAVTIEYAAATISE